MDHGQASPTSTANIMTDELLTPTSADITVLLVMSLKLQHLKLMKKIDKRCLLFLLFVHVPVASLCWLWFWLLFTIGIACALDVGPGVNVLHVYAAGNHSILTTAADLVFSVLST